VSRDLICPICGAEWDLDTVHDEVAIRAQKGERASFTRVVRQFTHEGCGVALRGTESVLGPLQCRRMPETAALADTARAIYELLGDDIDGAINEIEDYRLMFGDH
jgi:hypothetical protein